TVTWTKGGAKLGARVVMIKHIIQCAPICSFTYLEPPEIRPMAEEVQVVLHHGTVLPCEVQGLPRPSITWQREGVPICTCIRFMNMNLYLLIALKFSRVTLGDAGTYQCLAKNEAGVAVGRTKLVLQGNMAFCFQRCAHTRIFANGTLAIISTQRSDAGIYTCTAKNLAGRASQDMRLVIQGEQRLFKL
uniref:Ig-like domain-containing protein n=1 Tax=Echeneis naucrates TaxID=173247 RepID=A0A665WW12_ECHNA